MAGDGDNSGSGGAGPGGVGDGAYGGNDGGYGGGGSGPGTSGYSDAYGNVEYGTGQPINDGSFAGSINGYFNNMSWTDMMSYYSTAYSLANVPGVVLAGLTHAASYAARQGWGPDNGMTQAERASALSDGGGPGPLEGGTNWLDYGGGNPYYMRQQRAAQYDKSRLWADYINKFKPGSIDPNSFEHINPYKPGVVNGQAPPKPGASLLDEEESNGR